MDPKANVQEQVRLARIILQCIDAGDDESIPINLAERLAQLVIDLDALRQTDSFDPYYRFVTQELKAWMKPKSKI